MNDEVPKGGKTARDLDEGKLAMGTDQDVSWNELKQGCHPLSPHMLAGSCGGHSMNVNKAKGTRFESAVRDYFNSSGQSAHRIAQAGADVGDIHLNGTWALQCKDVAQQRYKEWVDDVDDQRLAAGLHFGAVVHKRRNAPVGDALVVMSLDQFAETASESRSSSWCVR